MTVVLEIRHMPYGCETNVVLGMFLMELTHLCCEILILECVLPSNTTNFIKLVSRCYMFQSYRPSSGSHLTTQGTGAKVNRYS